MANPYVNDQELRGETAEALSRLVADSYLLYLKTQGFHWNVVGPRFEPLHQLFQDQYTELAKAIDELAERVRALGTRAPGSFAEFSALSSITEENGVVTAEEMLRQLRADHSLAARSALGVVSIAERHGDVSTADLATQRVTEHEKAVWMLGSLLEQER